MCIVLPKLCSFFLVLHPSLCNVSDAKCGTSDMVTNVESQYHRTAKSATPRCETLTSSLLIFRPFAENYK